MSLQSSDPIADMLTRIRNAINVGKNEIEMPYSKIKETIARELASVKYLSSVEVRDAKPRQILVVTIAKPGENANITEIERVSKPGRRVYAGVSEIPKVKSGRGVILVSTSKGVMTGQRAIKERLGGELICKIY
ncbi:30S ribosomal protein S8 [Candidatus Saccharibacteria bacterium]|nr:MAG: 30S ribosomal protein S8 [Candidatus Saccharibacteria bacterium]